MTSPPAPREISVRKLLSDKFDVYAASCLQIRPKEGSLKPLELNRVQRFLHERAEEQLRRRGKVRIIILKGRQQGCSTYIEARLFWKVQHRRGVKAFILTHHADASSNLFNMARRFLDWLPEHSKPQIGTSSQRELKFAKLDSGYRVGTAGTEGVGRSDTIQLFHGSEVGFWPHADEHAAGALQAVPNEDGTEVWLEGTANGMGNVFHKQWQLAESGRSEYEAIFIPCYWSDEYSIDPGLNFRPEPHEIELQELFGLTYGQLAWRRLKISELGEAKFRQEYPMNAVEAFQASGGDSFIDPRLVMRARKHRDETEFGPLLLGVDPARFGDDDTALIFRRGRKAFGKKKFHGLDTMEVVGRLTTIIDETEPDKVFIDVGGLGAGIYDRLRELKYTHLVMPVNFGAAPSDDRRYTNKRAEMWARTKDWLALEGGVEVPDDDELHADLTTPQYQYDSLQRIKLEKKEDIRKRGLRSPDVGDALALTFAYPIGMKPEQIEKRPDPYAVKRPNHRRHWATR